jgi:hypothetical protein
MAFREGIIPPEFNRVLEERDKNLKSLQEVKRFSIYCGGTVYTVLDPTAIKSIEIIGALVDKFPPLAEDMPLRGDTIWCPDDNFEVFEEALKSYQKVFREDMGAKNWPEEVFLGLEPLFGSKSWVDELRVAAGKPVEKIHRYYGHRVCPGRNGTTCKKTGRECTKDTCPLYL